MSNAHFSLSLLLFYTLFESVFFFLVFCFMISYLKPFPFVWAMCRNMHTLSIYVRLIDENAQETKHYVACVFVYMSVCLNVKCEGECDDGGRSLLFSYGWKDKSSRIHIHCTTTLNTEKKNMNRPHQNLHTSFRTNIMAVNIRIVMFIRPKIKRQ